MSVDISKMITIDECVRQVSEKCPDFNRGILHSLKQRHNFPAGIMGKSTGTARIEGYYHRPFVPILCHVMESHKARIDYKTIHEGIDEAFFLIAQDIFRESGNTIHKYFVAKEEAAVCLEKAQHIIEGLKEKKYDRRYSKNIKNTASKVQALLEQHLQKRKYYETVEKYFPWLVDYCDSIEEFLSVAEFWGQSRKNEELLKLIYKIKEKRDEN